MNRILHTPVCDLLGCDLPIVLAGMGGVARSELVVAVTQAGGFGFLGMVRELPELIRSEVAKIRAATARDFGVNLIPAATKPDLMEAEIAAVLELNVPVVALFWDTPPELVRRLRTAGRLVVCQVGRRQEAEIAQNAGAHILIAQGIEAGGHVRGTTPRNELVKTVAAQASVPVLSAGGINTGRDLVEAMSLGAEGIVLGTALLATTESFAHDYHKRRIVEAHPGDTVLTTAFHVNWPPGANVRVLKNSVTRGELGDPFTADRRVIGREGERNIWLFSTDLPLKDMAGDFEKMALYAGIGSAAIDRIVPAGERIAAIIAGAGMLLPTNAMRESGGVAQEFSSPVCYTRDSDDVYAGYGSREELIDFCNLLLEAERAGARITARTATEAKEHSLRELLRAIHRDELACCAMLLKQLEHLGGTASRKTGDFYDKCLAISELEQRVALINRGQGWVARKIWEMLPKMRDDDMHADFEAMLKLHEVNMARVDGELGRK